ncbi:MAG: Ig-like domain-containing protein [Planctomycetota bacterium]
MESLAVFVLLAGCTGGGVDAPSPGGPGGGGGGSGNSGGSPASWGSQLLSVVSSIPSDRAVQVGLTPTLVVQFDGDLAAETLSFPDTQLRRAEDGQQVPIQRSVGSDRTEAEFTPNQPLAPATDYVLTLSPLTADQDGRVLDRTTELRFRTEDHAPPMVLGWQAASTPPRLGPDGGLTLHFDEELAPESVLPGTILLRGTDGRPIDVDLEVDGATVHCLPVRDVAGSAELVLSARGVEDRSGNRMETAWSASLQTASDQSGPTLLAVWPAQATDRPGPRAPVHARFDESLMGASPDGWFLARNPASGQRLPYKAFASRDGRTIHFLPTADIAPDTAVEIVPSADGLRATDASGNQGSLLPTLRFVVGHDRMAPRPQRIEPGADTSAFPAWGQLRIRFDDAMALDSIETAASALRDDEGCLVPLAPPELDPSGTELVLTPASALQADARYALHLPAGLDGLRDRSGNLLEASIDFSFRTHPRTSPPALISFPATGTTGVARNASLVLVCDEALVADEDALLVLRADGATVDGTWSPGPRADSIRFTPAGPWTAGTEHRVVIQPGPEGLRTTSGLYWSDAITHTFRTGYRDDLDAPAVEIQVAGVSGHHAEGRILAPAGYAITVADPAQGDPGFDPTACSLELLGPGGALLATAIAQDARATAAGLEFRVPIASPLPVGSITARATAADLSGNRSATTELRFEVVARSTEILPFETTQVVWVRTDLDRDGNGRNDFDDDLHRLGLVADGDPLGHNARLRAILIDGVLARTRELFGRDRNGAPMGPEPIPIRLSDREPLGVAHMQIACGGFDPEGPAGRRAGDASTGVLGRAWYDYRNATPNERNTSRDPGLGVFPAELWLFETRVHRDVYPSFVTSYAQLFLGLAPDLGGTPAGRHPLDAEALAPGFDPDTGSAPAAARYHAIFAAADAWATAIGTILAHEIGHSVGLTATGTDTAGLHGDASLHNVASSSRDVMATALGFDALTSLAFRFRPLNDAYLRQAVVLR